MCTNIAASLSFMKIQCAHSEIADLDLLVPNPKNPNKHPDNQIKLLAKIMDHQGWRSPIVVSNRSGFITKGHGRLMAAKLNGWAKGPVDRQDYENEADEYADMVADNKIAELAETDMMMVNKDAMDLGPDFDLELLGIPDFEIVPTEELDPQCDPDDLPEHVEPRAKLGDIYQLGRHRLMCGDSTSIDAVEKLMAGEKADMVFTDPPYGMNAVSKSGVLSKNYKTDILGDSDTSAAKDSFNLAIGIYPNAKHIWWGANYYSSTLPNSECWIVWDKNNGQSDQTDCELAWTNFRSVVRQFTQASEKSNRVHPTQKPVSLFEWTLERFNVDPKNVLDIFGGSGSTLIACEKTNRKCFMMELDPHYIDVIVARWEKYTSKKAELINGEIAIEEPKPKVKSIPKKKVIKKRGKT